MLKLKIGAPPENPMVMAEGTWRAIVGYGGDNVSALRILAVGAASSLTIAGLWKALVSGSLAVELPSFTSALVVIFMLVIVHEALHLLAFPGAGVSDAVIGLWPAKGAAYVQYTRPTSRRRFIVATLTPGFVLSAGILFAAVWGVGVPASLQWTSVLNAFGSGADMLAVYFLIQQSSPSSVVLESSQGLYTRDAQPGHP